MTTKTKTRVDVDREAVESARARLAEAESRLAALRREEERLTLEQASLRRFRSSSALAPDVRARMTAVDKRADELLGGRGRGEIEIAIGEVSTARKALEEALNPVPSAEVADRRLAEVRGRHAELMAEQTTLPERIREAALAGDLNRQHELFTRSDELPGLVAVSAREVAQATLAHARAMVAASVPPAGEPETVEHRRWRQVESDARRRISDLASAAVADARSRQAPVVRSVWQGVPEGAA